MRLAVAMAALVVVCALATADDAAAYRSKRGAKPTVRILTRDLRAALRERRLVLRVTVRKRARLHVEVLALDLGSRSIFVTRRKTLHLPQLGSRRVNIRLTRSALRALRLTRAACRSTRLTAFLSARSIRPGRPDSPRTTLVRDSRTLRPHRRGCRPAPPGTPPDLGGGGSGHGKPPTGPISIRAGAADADITPPVGTPMFAYTARSNVFSPGVDGPLQIVADPDKNLYAKTFVPSHGIHSRVRARAIVIEKAGKKFALVQADLGGLPFALTQEVLKRIASTGITGDRLLLSATHTHSSSGAIWSADNMGYGLVGGDAYDPRIFDHIAGGISAAVIAANQRMVGARIGVGSARIEDASRNRRFDQFLHDTDIPKDQTAAKAVSIDPRVTVVRVDAANGSPIGVWSNFAVHPTSFGAGNLLFSGDNAATTERLVEQQIARDGSARGAAPAHAPVDVWTNANEGDIAPNGDPTTDPTVSSGSAHSNLDYVANSFGSANLVGQRVAEGVLAAWRAAGGSMSGSPVIDVRHIFMALDGTPAGGEPVGPVPVLGAGGIVAPDGTCAPADNFAGPGQGEKFPLVIGPGSVPIVHPVSLMRIGPLAVAAFPSELTKQMGARIRAAIAAVAGAKAPAGAIVAGLTNSYNSYVATPEEYAACQYEGSFTLWGRQQGPRYRDLATALAKSLFGGASPPASAAEPAQISPGTAQPPSVRPTPSAGTIVSDVPAQVSRLGQAQFKWNGGDPAIDAPRGKAFVTLERRSGNRFAAVATEDSVFDVTEHARDDSWTETWQFTECDPLGTYRFVVRGVANTGSGAAPYTVTSKPFELRKSTGISVFSKTVVGGVAHVRAEYGGFPARPLAVLPLRVRTGFAVLRVKAPDGTVTDRVALPDASGLEFTAHVPDGASIESASVEDSCGNTG